MDGWTYNTSYDFSPAESNTNFPYNNYVACALIPARNALRTCKYWGTGDLADQCLEFVEDGIELGNGSNISVQAEGECEEVSFFFVGCQIAAHSPLSYSHI
jgi:hypothetical protein